MPDVLTPRCGLRPNSPTATTSVSESSPRWSRSSISADTPASSIGADWVFIRWLSPVWTSHEWLSELATFGQITSTTRVPASTSRRARRQHWPNVLRPYRSRTCGGSAVTLAAALPREFPNFEDVRSYEGRTIRLYKRAQILPADLWGAFGGEGPGRFDDIAGLTAFADYKVPQVLEALGVLRYADGLAEALRNGDELGVDSTWEVELRALTGLLGRTRTRLSQGWLDPWLLLDAEGRRPQPPAGTTPVELAAHALVARAILNLDEAITKE